MNLRIRQPVIGPPFPTILFFGIGGHYPPGPSLATPLGSGECVPRREEMPTKRGRGILNKVATVSTPLGRLSTYPAYTVLILNNQPHPLHPCTHRDSPLASYALDNTMAYQVSPCRGPRFGRYQTRLNAYPACAVPLLSALT